MTAKTDTEILRNAPASSDDWDDDTWAAWWRAAERAQEDRGKRIDQLEGEIAELEAKLAIREAQVERLDNVIEQLQNEIAELTRAFGLNEPPEVAA
ncbi:MAG TPA: hypothetical protein VIP28_12585 [Nocardioides sp.]